MANDPRKPFIRPAPLPLPTPPGSQPPSSASKDKDKGGAALPLWNSSTGGDKMAGMPMFRGAGQKSNNLLGRLKSLKTKDVAFIGAGLAVLVMAPLAEYLISEGEDPNGTLTQGFAQNGMPFANGNDPSEIGIMGLARGGVPGDNTDVITPLNARDPSSLIMGGMGEKEPPASAPAPEVRRDAPKDVWDKVVSSAKSGASAATRKVSLPKPGGKLAGAINGLRSLSGGSTSASLKLAAPDSKGLFSSPRNENHLAKTQTPPGYRGAGQRVIAGGSGGNFDGRRGAGGFGSPGGGMAGDVMSGGIAGGGGRGTGFSGGDGDPTKNPGGNSTKDAKTLGESLAFLRQKMEMEKAIDLKWAKKRYNELERKKMIEQTLVQTAQQAFMKVLDKLLEGKKDGAGSPSGGSPPGGGKPDGGQTGGKDQTGNGAATPAGNLGGGTTIAKGDKAKPAVDAATGAEKSVKGSVSVHESSRKTVAGALPAGVSDPNWKDLQASLDKIRPAVNEAAALKLGDLGKPLEKAAESVKAFKDAIDAEKKRMDGEAKLATDGKADLAGHKSTPDPKDKEMVDLSNGETLKERATAAEAAGKTPTPFDPAEGVKAAKQVLKDAEAAQKLVAKANEGLGEISNNDKVPPGAKKTLLDTIAPQVKNMDAALKDIVKGANAYVENMNAVKEYTTSAGQQLDAAIKTNDKIPEKVTKAIKDGATLSAKWKDKQKKAIVTEKETASTALETASKEATTAATTTEKINTSLIGE